MDNLNMVLFLLALVLSTQSTRLLPLVFERKVGIFFQRENFRNKFIQVIFFLLICYCFRDFSYTKEYGLRLFCAVVVILLQYFLEKTLFSIFAGTLLFILGVNLL